MNIKESRLRQDQFEPIKLWLRSYLVNVDHFDPAVALRLTKEVKLDIPPGTSEIILKNGFSMVLYGDDISGVSMFLSYTIPQIDGPPQQQIQLELSGLTRVSTITKVSGPNIVIRGNYEVVVSKRGVFAS
jgi:hypothetical protein